MKLQNFDITSSETAFADGVSTGDELITAGTLAGRVISRDHAVNIQNVVSVEDKNDYCGVWCVGTEKSAVRNGGLIGEIQTANQSTAKVTVKKCSASVYVQSSVGTVDTFTKQPKLKEVDIAGGLIGHIESNVGEVSVSDSYAGGHTSKTQYSSNDKTRGKSGVGRNVVSYGCSGGLIGAVFAAKKGQISLSADYSTASVACVYKNKTVAFSDAGGLIGYVSKNVENIKAENCYSTGLVEGDIKGGVIGYIALESTNTNSVALAFNNCRFLSGVSTEDNDDDIAAVNILRQHAAPNQKQVIDSHERIAGSLYPVDDKTLAAGNGKTKAVPYDSELKGNYPYASSMSCHYGDWPIVIENTEKKQNRLMLTYDTRSELIAIRLTGLQSGAHMYLVMNADTTKYGGPQVGVANELKNCFEFDNNRKVRNLFNAGWGEAWKKIFSITKDQNTGVYHYELMLDNVSTAFAGFASLSNAVKNPTPNFYYGEYIDVRITDEITENTDLAINGVAKEEYVTNTLFEDIFDPSVVDSDTLQNGTVNLNNEAVQNSIKALKHIQTGSDGKEYIADINYPVQTKLKQYVAVINSARHLENLRSDVSGINTQQDFTVTNAVQGCDIIWNSTTAGDITGTNHEYDAYVNELQELNKDRGGSDIYQDGAPHVYNGCILPVDIENDNELVSYNGNENGIYGLKLGYSTAGPDGGKSGLFGIISGTNKKFNISNLKLFNTIYDESANLQTVGTIVAICNRDLTLNKVIIGQSGGDLSGLQMKGSIECGGMVGQANAGLEVSDCAISLEGKTLSIYGGTGGAAGIAAICNGDITIQNTTISAANIQISGTFYTGGMIGHAFSSADISGSSLEAPSVSVSNTGGNNFCGGLVAMCSGGSINNCHISGLKGVASDTVISITAVASDSGTNQTGGLVGNVSGNTAFTMSNSWLGADLATVSNFSSKVPAGGLIGEVWSPNLTVENCYFTGENARVMSGREHQGSVGGLIGEAKITSNEGCRISNSFFSGYVYGPAAQYVGGLIGKLESDGTEQEYSSIENCYVSGRTYQGLFPQDSAELTSGTDSEYDRFTMPDDQTKLSDKPIDSIIGYEKVGGLIGNHERGNLRISDSFTTTSVASNYDQNYDGGCVGGLIGSTCGLLKLSNTYAVSTVESKKENHLVKGSFIANDSAVDKTSVDSACYVINELNDASVQPVGKMNPQNATLSITGVSVNQLGTANLLRDMPASDDTDVVRDATLQTYYSNGYPYKISTVINGRKYFDGCWINLKEVQPTIQLSENAVTMAVGGTLTLTATISPRWKTGENVHWSSEDEGVAKVDENGTVTGVSIGTTTITAKLDNESSATCSVTVKEDSITVNGTVVEENSTQYFPQYSNITFGISGSVGEEVTWSFSPNLSGERKDTGEITVALPLGKTTVTATISKDGNTISKTITVVVLDSDAVSNFRLYPDLQPVSGNLAAGDTRELKGYTAYGNLNLYISDTNSSDLFGNTATDGSHVMYFKVGKTPFTIQVNNTIATIQYQSVWGTQTQNSVSVSTNANGTEIIFNISLQSIAETSVSTISLQQYGSTSPDNPYPYTLTGLLSF